MVIIKVGDSVVERVALSLCNALLIYVVTPIKQSVVGLERKLEADPNVR